RRVPGQVRASVHPAVRRRPRGRGTVRRLGREAELRQDVRRPDPVELPGGTRRAARPRLADGQGRRPRPAGPGDAALDPGGGRGPLTRAPRAWKRLRPWGETSEASRGNLTQGF